jgi:transcriptional regulator with XRE-family HTH domain
MCNYALKFSKMHETIEVKIFNKKELTAQIIKVRGVLTQEQFAEQLGAYGVKVSRSKVSRWEDGITEPSASELAAIAAFARCSIDEVVYGRGAEVEEGIASKIAKEVVSQLNILGNNEKVMSFLNSGWNSKQVARAKSLMERSLEKAGHASLRDALVAVGVTGNYAILQEILDGQRGTYVVPTDTVRAMALICYVPVDWNGENEPTGLTDSTYGGDTAKLMRDLTNGSNCRA